MSSAEGVFARVAGELLETVVDLAASASAEEQASIRADVETARARLKALPELGPAIAAAAEARRRELASGTTPASRLEHRSGGQIAFEAYTAKRGGKNHDGTPTPAWGQLGDAVREGWEVAAAAARSAP